MTPRRRFRPRWTLADFGALIRVRFLERRLHEAADAADAARTREGPALG